MRKADNLTPSVPLSRNLGTLTFWNPLGHSRPVMGLLYLYLYQCFHGNQMKICDYSRCQMAGKTTLEYMLLLILFNPPQPDRNTLQITQEHCFSIRFSSLFLISPFCEFRISGSVDEYIDRKCTEWTTLKLLMLNNQRLLKALRMQSRSYSQPLQMYGSIRSSFILFPVSLRPNAGHGLLILEVSRSHTTTHHRRQDSSGRVISASQRTLPDNTQHSQETDIHSPD